MKFKFKSKEVEIKYESTRIKYCYIWAGIVDTVELSLLANRSLLDWQENRLHLFFFPFRLENSKSRQSETDDHSRSKNIDTMSRPETWREMEVSPQQEEGNLDTSAIYYSEEERQHEHNSRVTFLLA